MRKLLFTVAILVCLPVCLFAWTDTTGSSDTITDADLIIVDIQNAVFDKSINAWRVTIATGPQDTYVLISTNTEAVLAEMIKGYVLISTNGDTTITRLDTVNTELIEHYVLMSTNTVATLAEMVKQYVLISTGGDTTVTRLDTINTEQIKNYVLSSSNTAAILTELIKAYVLTSTGTDTAVTRLDTIYDQLKTSITISDILYSGKVSTGTAGKTFVSANVTIIGDMDFYMFYARGGDATATGSWFSGTKYIFEGIPFKPDKLSIPETNPTFQFILDAGTTLYYDTHVVTKP